MVVADTSLIIDTFPQTTVRAVQCDAIRNDWCVIATIPGRLEHLVPTASGRLKGKVGSVEQTLTPNSERDPDYVPYGISFSLSENQSQNAAVNAITQPIRLG